ncbi:hypothetical protein [Dyella sp. M7H15-1]|uniref:hypothetical protein n=1 Tax=Dyella sp. M7H15-1 TaxID=2501295 RepID=UPI0013E89CB1|nr:hypothetical protein [Dyella sp. M7H15-1]
MKTDSTGMLIGFPLHDSGLIKIGYAEGNCELLFERLRIPTKSASDSELNRPPLPM